MDIEPYNANKVMSNSPADLRVGPSILSRVPNQTRRNGPLKSIETNH